MKSVLLEREARTHGDGDAKAREEALLTEGRTRYPTFEKLHMMAGQFYEDLGDLDGARKHLRDGLASCPKSIALWKQLTRLEEKTKGEMKARSVLESGRLKNPKNPELWLEAIRLEARHHNDKGQENLMAKALQECPDAGILLAESIDIAPRTQQRRPPAAFKYIEVVRKRDERMALPGHACDECARYYAALGDEFDGDQFACSRHRAKWEPYATPEDFWRLSFPDSAS
ncbi:hypothetical protein DYB31_006462 [Aphanomyces astaci]|nr:hypothetical protein DYB31_006462 [Aphanomyces astaci]